MLMQDVFRHYSTENVKDNTTIKHTVLKNILSKLPVN